MCYSCYRHKLYEDASDVLTGDDVVYRTFDRVMWTSWWAVPLSYLAGVLITVWPIRYADEATIAHTSTPTWWCWFVLLGVSCAVTRCFLRRWAFHVAHVDPNDDHELEALRARPPIDDRARELLEAEAEVDAMFTSR